MQIHKVLCKGASAGAFPFFDLDLEISTFVKQIQIGVVCDMTYSFLWTGCILCLGNR